MNTPRRKPRPMTSRSVRGARRGRERWRPRRDGMRPKRPLHSQARPRESTRPRQRVGDAGKEDSGVPLAGWRARYQSGRFVKVFVCFVFGGRGSRARRGLYPLAGGVRVEVWPGFRVCSGRGPSGLGRTEGQQGKVRPRVLRFSLGLGSLRLGQF